MKTRKPYTRTVLVKGLFVVSKATQEDLKGKTNQKVSDELYRVISNLKAGEKVSMPISLKGTLARLKKHEDFSQFNLTTRVSADKKCVALIRIA